MDFFRKLPLSVLTLCFSHKAAAAHQACTAEQFAQDTTCNYRNDGSCNADELCEIGTDCIDCDPCRAFDITSCETCTSNDGCSWCASDGICVATGVISAIIDDPKFMCGATDEFSEGPASCAAESDTNLFDDPLISAQNWVYELINVLPVWQSGITGAGISIRINDEGVAADHPDLSSKFDVASSCPGAYLPIDPLVNTHGTTCASIAAASANTTCSVGIAPDAQISSCLVFPVGTVSRELFFYAPPGGKMDISSNSYADSGCTDPTSNRRSARRLQGRCPFSSTNDFSPCNSPLCSTTDWSATSIEDADCRSEITSYCDYPFNFENDVVGCLEFLDLFVDECTYNTMLEDQRFGLIKGVTEGRDGKGIIHIAASGNHFADGDDTNFAGFQQSRFTISVGSVGKLGTHASYSTPGASLFMTAPGGDFEFGNNHVVALASGGCWDAGVGTSYSAPVVAGVVALMLEVNPELGWRDVQGILATTCQKNDSADSSWSTNGAGLHHSPKYGFGLVDALAAVDASSSWTNFSPERMILKDSGPINIGITDDASVSSSSTITVDSADIIVESVVVYVNVSHATRGDLAVMLTSPNGTESMLVSGNRPESSQGVQNWKLLTVRAWGESPVGDWTVSIADVSPGDMSTCQDQAWRSPDGIGEGVDIFCNDLESLGLCANGTTTSSFEEKLVNIVDADGLPAVDSALASCCVCGGGDLAENVNDVLHSWQLVLYGHDDLSIHPTLVPTSSAPTQAPTMMTTVTPDFAISRTPTPIPVDIAAPSGATSNSHHHSTLSQAWLLFAFTIWPTHQILF